jgi:hypothetical protein
MSIRKPRRYYGRKIKSELWKPKIKLGKWIIYIGPTVRDWTNIKVVCDGRSKHKANYWMAWNGSRLSNVQDARIMELNSPQLIAAVTQAMRNYSEKQLTQ